MTISTHGRHFAAYLIPQRHVKAEIHVKVLMMVIMEYGVRLPRLPPIRLKCDARVIDDPVIVCVQ